MSKYPFLLCSISLPLATVLGVALTMTAQTQVLGREAGNPVPWVRLDGFTQSDGVNVFALTLKPSAPRDAGAPVGNGPRDVVILVSTAASQSGDYRAKSLATLQSVLAKLDPGDRVKLVAFDLNAATLTQGFVAPNSAEMTAAFSALRQRTPLGSCDLEKALDTAAKSFAADSKSPRAIVYIGDGSSRANLLTVDQLDRIVNDLAALRAPVISFGVGPQIQEQMLGILASRTGGEAVPERASVDAGVYGSYLARAVHGSVLWPKAGAAVKWPEGMDVYPKIFPPLRADRDTVLVGAAKSTAAGHVEIDFDNGPAGAERLAWDIPELKSNAGNGYLVTLVDQAKVDGGRTLPLVDSASLATAKQEIESGGRGLENLAREALKGGNFDSADKLAGEALRRNPSDLSARAIKDAIAKLAGRASARAGAAIGPAAKPGDMNLHGGDGGPAPPDGTAAVSEISQATALEEQWQKDVQNTINKARSLVTVDPDKAETTIQQKTSDLTTITELRPEIRDPLTGMLHTASREIKHRKEDFLHRQQDRIQQAMAQRDIEMTNLSLRRDQDKVKQLMERFDALMAEGRYRLAEESAALEAQRIVRNSLPSADPTARVAMLSSRFTGAYDEGMAVRVAAQKGVVDSMCQTEKSHVACPDDPPIVYPDSESWKELTARRTERFGAKENSKPSPAEKKIQEALKQLTQIEFIETPLNDVIEYLKDLHHIEIQLDLAALKEAGIDENTPVTKSLKGISLRSALRLLLEDLQLTFVVHNEVLLITTPEKAKSEEFLSIKVYPVADIVVPIKDTGFTGGFGSLSGQRNSLGSGIIGNNLFGNGNPMGNNNQFGNNNQPGNNNQLGNNVWNVAHEILPRGN